MTEQIAFRFDASLAKRLARFTRAQAVKSPVGVRFTRADAVRMLLEQGLERAGLGAEVEHQRHGTPHS